MRIFRKLCFGLSLACALLLFLYLDAPALASSADAVWPELGSSVENDGKLRLDDSHMDQGYVMACVSETTKNRMKVRVSVGKIQMMYDISSSGEYVAFPLQFGSGKYVFELFENVKSSKYSAAGKLTLNVKLRDENAAFLVPNQYVDYDISTAAVKKSDELTAGLSGDQAIFDRISDFMVSEFTYDFVRASTISSGELPEIDQCFEKRSGICQDLSAVMACMLRVQGVGAKLVIGYADKYYHAWIVAIVDGKEVFYDPTAAIGCLKAKKYKIERFY